MRKLLSTFIIACTLLTNFAKAQETTSNIFDNYSNAQIKAMAQNLSEVHGQALDDIYDNLEELITSELTEENVLGFINGNIGAHIKNYLIQQLSMGADDPIANYGCNFSDADPVLSGEVLFALANGSLLPTEQFSVEIDRINDILQSENSSEDKINAINAILEENASSIENNFEKFLLYSCAYIAINSINYWDSNVILWENKLSEMHGGETAAMNWKYSPMSHVLYQNAITVKESQFQVNNAVMADLPNNYQKKIDKEGVIMQDVAAAGVNAVAWAAWGGAGGTMVIPGVGTVGGAAVCGLYGMIRGTITGSVGNALVSWIKSLF